MAFKRPRVQFSSAPPEFRLTRNREPFSLSKACLCRFADLLKIIEKAVRFVSDGLLVSIADELPEGPVPPERSGFSALLSAAKRRPGAGNAADGFIHGFVAGRGQDHFAGTAVEGRPNADLTGNGVLNGRAGIYICVARRSNTGLAEQRRTGTDLTRNGMFNGGTLDVAKVTHTYSLWFSFFL